MLTRRNFFLILLAFASAAAYLGFAYTRGALGFPLDDAWIHQVYARNLGTRGEFAFFEGQPSAGSTSPLWTILLSVGYALRIDFRVWAYVLGALLLGASVIAMGRLATRITFLRNSSDGSHAVETLGVGAQPASSEMTSNNSAFTVHSSLVTVFCSLFILFEWHLAWSAVSGMEIPLFVFLSLLLLERFYAHERAVILGLIAGLLTLTRPEGAVLGALVGLGIILDADTCTATNAVRCKCFRGFSRITKNNPRSSAFIRVLIFAFGFAILVASYLAFNLAVGGAIFPNTFYAKNAEYAILIERTPLLIRLAQTFAAPWVGAQLLLLPGFVFVIARLIKNRDWVALVPLAWILALPALYALRLPVTYQHARYEMPVIPFIAVYGVWGTIELLGRVKNFVVRGAWAMSTGVLLLAFWFYGASAYANNVAFIDCEMVQTAHWVAQNVPNDALIAAHDIGALGYFYPRPFIDLAGLVSPEVIPFIRDEIRLKEFLLHRDAQYVIVFPDWYESLVREYIPVFQTVCAATRAEGGANMAVYEIRLTTK